jgi:hypothetical protein
MSAGYHRRCEQKMRAQCDPQEHHKLYREAWIRALESGQWECCSDHLRVGDSYDAMGILCTIVADEVQGEWIQIDGDTRWFFRVPGCAREEQAPHAVLVAAGVPDSTAGMLESCADLGETHAESARRLRISFGMRSPEELQSIKRMSFWKLFFHRLRELWDPTVYAGRQWT